MNFRLVLYCSLYKIKIIIKYNNEKNYNYISDDNFII